ncbi:MAG: hypothetical protein HOO67_08080 [Candidatus Peribacteraceae bacterium]|nr:hypothetical protein [Candidatus Peribacteraceae bacterium]
MIGIERIKKVAKITPFSRKDLLKLHASSLDKAPGYVAAFRKAFSAMALPTTIFINSQKGRVLTLEISADEVRQRMEKSLAAADPSSAVGRNDLVATLLITHVMCGKRDVLSLQTIPFTQIRKNKLVRDVLASVDVSDREMAWWGAIHPCCVQAGHDAWEALKQPPVTVGSPESEMLFDAGYQLAEEYAGVR